MIENRILPLISAFSAMALLALSPSARATQVGEIFVCYACQNTGVPAIDAALANNPSVANDGILFDFVNTSGADITGGVFSENGSPNDSFAFPTIAAGTSFILMPGITSDGGTHPSGGLFGATGVMDTSDGAGGLTDSTEFTFTGLQGALAVSSLTAGSSTPTPGSFTPGDPGPFMPYVGNPSSGETSFIGQGPNGDGPCSNCYFGLVATLDVPNPNNPPPPSSPEPASLALLAAGSGFLAWVRRARRH